MFNQENLRKYGLGAVVATAMTSNAFAQSAPTDLSGLASAVSFDDVKPALYAVAGTLIGVAVIIFGIKKVRSMIGNK